MGGQLTGRHSAFGIADSAPNLPLWYRHSLSVLKQKPQSSFHG